MGARKSGWFLTRAKRPRSTPTTTNGKIQDRMAAYNWAPFEAAPRQQSLDCIWGWVTHLGDNSYWPHDGLSPGLGFRISTSRAPRFGIGPCSSRRDAREGTGEAGSMPVQANRRFWLVWVDGNSLHVLSSRCPSGEHWFARRILFFFGSFVVGTSEANKQIGKKTRRFDRRSRFA
jgi:hypothetical protein